MGTASMSRDICDKCWGSGDKYRTFTDIRELEKKLRAKAGKEASEWLAKETGVRFRQLRPVFYFIADQIEKLDKKRKLPENLASDERNYHNGVKLLSRTIREMCDAEENFLKSKEVIDS
jgi:hypothetical protein